jgi:HEAT repeat protein
MTKKEIRALIAIFRERDTFESKIWEKYKYAKAKLIKYGNDAVEELIAVLTSEENRIAHFAFEILIEIGDERALPHLQKMYPFYPDGVISGKMQAIRDSAAVSQVNLDVKKLIENLSYDDRVESIREKWFARIVLIRNGKNVIDTLLKDVTTKNQNLLLSLAEVLGEIGDSKAVPYLQSALNRKNNWGATIVVLAVALIKLNNKMGLEYMKRMITNTETFRDLRLSSAQALYNLGLKNVFRNDEIIDFTGESMTKGYPEKLKALVESLV